MYNAPALSELNAIKIELEILLHLVVGGQGKIDAFINIEFNFSLSEYSSTSFSKISISSLDGAIRNKSS